MTECTRIISDYDETLAAPFRTAWDSLLKEASPATLFFQSPRYFDHLADTLGRAKIALAAVEDRQGAIGGIIPLRIAKTTLDFRIRNWYFGKLSFSSVAILGGRTLSPRSSDMYESLFRQLAGSFESCRGISIYGL